MAQTGNVYGTNVGGTNFSGANVSNTKLASPFDRFVLLALENIVKARILFSPAMQKHSLINSKFTALEPIFV
jgi:hypothetical protein